MVKTVIVDDTPETQEVLASLVRAAGGVVTFTSAYGQDVMTFIAEQGADLVITDYQMPQMRGDDVARNVHEQFPQVMVAMITVQDDWGTRQRASAATVDQFLSKPVTVTQMEELIRLAKNRQGLRRMALGPDYWRDHEVGEG